MNASPKTTDDTINIKELFFSLIAQWKLIALCTALSAILTFFYVRTTPNVYSTDALIQVDNKKTLAASALLGDLNRLPTSGSSSAASGEIEILNSRSVFAPVVKNLHLDITVGPKNTSRIDKILNPSNPNLEYTTEGVRYSNKGNSIFVQRLDIPQSYLDKSLTLSFTNNNEFTLSNNDEVLLKGVVNQLNTINNAAGLWNVHINTNTGFKDALAISKLTELNAIKRTSSGFTAAENTRNSGIVTLALLGEDPQHITKVLNNILSVYHQDNITRKTQESKQTLSFLDTQLPEIKQQLETAENKFNQFRETNNTIDVTQESQLLLQQNVALEAKRFELKQKKAELSARYTDDFPLMVEINSQLSALDKRAGELSSTLTKLPEKQREYLQLYRDVQINTQLYTNLLNSYQQLKIAEAGEVGSVRVIDNAVEPLKPIKPRRSALMLLGIFAGLLLGMLLALARNLLRSGIQNAKDIENELDLPVYATVPRSEKQERRIKILRKKKQLPILAVKHSDDIAIESLRSIRTAIHFALMNAKNNAIMLSGPAPELGKSFISVNLATIFAQSGKRVLLIDADIRRGYLHKYFNQSTQPGLSNYLLNTSNLEQVIHHTAVENLDFMSRGANPPNPSELLDSARFQELLEILNQKYDYVIIDTPPVLAVTDPVIVSRYAGINLLIARFGRTNIKELETSIDRFEQAGSKITGVILNDVQRTASSGYNYNYNYAYTATKED
ncbi:polysaccharide biosynthesis tyrosine autokinase [Acinetobacter sp. c3-l95]|uniref:polysaccharide biosynthesis tyrosine autokinase n=1 Tax=Acinetobacter sp. c3-l95 TaxID=3342804 RepID=UPI0035B878B9